MRSATSAVASVEPTPVGAREVERLVEHRVDDVDERIAAASRSVLRIDEGDRNPVLRLAAVITDYIAAHDALDLEIA
jgi:hypothetical protein